MTLLGHASPEMTLRYAQLASPTLRAAYDQAIGKIRRRIIPIAPVIGGHAIPNDVDWLRSEMLKTRSPTATAPGPRRRGLPYANICETCSNFTTTPSSSPPSPRSSTTSRCSAATPSNEAGPPRPPATPG